MRPLEFRLLCQSGPGRRYAAECMQMSQGHQNAETKAMLVEMAAMWLRLADFAERSGGADNSSPAV